MTYRGSLSVQEKILAALPYTIALVAGLPALEKLATFFPGLPIDQILFPLLLLPALLFSILGSNAIPIIFFALFIFVVRNAKVKHFIRYHSMQSLMIGIMVTLTEAMQFLMGPVLRTFSSTLSLVVSAVVVVTSIYSLICALMGNYTNIPLISDASEAQTRY